LSLWTAAIAATAGIAVFFVWANRQTAKAHARFTPKDVEAALTELLDPQAHDHDNWDLFLGWRIKDPYLESIRVECLRKPLEQAEARRSDSTTVNRRLIDR